MSIDGLLEGAVFNKSKIQSESNSQQVSNDEDDV